MHMRPGQRVGSSVNTYRGSCDGRVAQAAIYGELQRQATLLVFVNNFRMLALICLVCAWSVVLFKRVRGRKAVPSH